MNLSNFFIDNEKEIKSIILSHPSKFNNDVVFSNVYLHLYKNKKSLSDKNAMAFVVSYVSKLKHWNMNRGVILEDLQNNKMVALEDYEIECNGSHIIDFETHFNDFIISIPDYYERCVFRDFYKTKIETVKEIASYYSVSQRKAYTLKKRIIELEKQLYKFIKNRL